MQANININDEEKVLHFLYQPTGNLPPIQSGCSTFVETYGGGDEILSGLTFVSINCEAIFLNGLAPQQIWFQVSFPLCIF